MDSQLVLKLRNSVCLDIEFLKHVSAPFQVHPTGTLESECATRGRNTPELNELVQYKYVSSQ